MGACCRWAGRAGWLSSYETGLGGIILSEQGRGQRQGSGERWPERAVFPELGQVLRHALGWANAGGGGGVSSPVIFKEVYRKAPGVSCTLRGPFLNCSVEEPATFQSHRLWVPESPWYSDFFSGSNAADRSEVRNTCNRGVTAGGKAGLEKGEKPAHTEEVMAKCKVQSQMIACRVASQAGVTHTTQMTT